MRLVAVIAFALSLQSQAFAAVVTPKALCDGFEMAPLTVGLGCGADSKAGEAYRRAKQQCLELLEFSVGEKRARARIDQDAAKRCIEARRAQQKDPSLAKGLGDTVRSACAKAIVGLQKSGQSCDSAWECAQGLTCIGAGGPKPGTCAKPLAGAAACDDSFANDSALHALFATLRSPCGEGRHCAASPTGSVCKKSVAAGGACAASDPRACSPGLRCDKGRCVDETRAPRGGACAADLDCRLGDRCEKGRCASSPSKCG